MFSGSKEGTNAKRIFIGDSKTNALKTNYLLVSPILVVAVLTKSNQAFGCFICQSACVGLFELLM